MKTRIVFPVTVVYSFLILHSAFGQGSLSPPGPPAPIMKSLDQIEPRTPISSAPVTLTNSGSYYLTTNLNVTGNGQNAVIIATNGVTLDLNGFALSSTAPSPIATGVLINSGLRDISIFNGHVKSFVTNNGPAFSGTGFGYGIYYLGTSPVNVLVSQVTVSGVQFHGINLGTGYTTAVKSCTVNVSGNTGIFASALSDCTALNCGGTALSAYTVQNCYGSSVSSGDGIDAQVAQNCYGASTGGGAGLSVNTALNCYGSSGSGVGLSSFLAQNSYAVTGTGNYGLRAGYSAENCFGINGGTSYGLSTDGFALNCYGVSESGTGLTAANAENCGGSTLGTAVGLSATVAGDCLANSGATAIQANIGIGCYAVSGTNDITHKYNMP